MPAVTLRTLRADVAAKLSELETGAAVLERDLRRERALLRERGFALPTPQTRYSAWQTARSRLLRGLARAWRACVLAAGWLVRRAKSEEVAAVFRLARHGVAEGAVYAAVAGATLIVLAAAIVALAPPD